MNLKLMILASACTVFVACKAADESPASEVKTVTNWGEVRAKGLCLDVPRSTHAHVRLNWWHCNGTNAQKFKQESFNGGFLLVNVGNNKAVDMRGGTDHVVQGDWLWNTHQRFYWKFRTHSYRYDALQTDHGFLCAPSHAGEQARYSWNCDVVMRSE